MADENLEELSGLQYLNKVRPEAMEHLLAFFRESSRCLDPKTRFLISVVTKVINFSARGLRQYIPRAMREGASRDEVIDAILCAYPAAGLTRVVDAIEVLRSLDLSAFEKEDGKGSPAGDVEDDGEGEWIDALAADELPMGESRVVELGEQRIALFNVGGEIRAISDTCLHQGAQLGMGSLEGEVVTCPLHGWQFDVRTGACLTRPGRSVETYEVRSEDGRIFVLA